MSYFIVGLLCLASGYYIGWKIGHYMGWESTVAQYHEAFEELEKRYPDLGSSLIATLAAQSGRRIGEAAIQKALRVRRSKQ